MDFERFAGEVTPGKTASDQITEPMRHITARHGAGAARKVVRDLSTVFRFVGPRVIVRRSP
jgi:hypothetical protein